MLYGPFENREYTAQEGLPILYHSRDVRGRYPWHLITATILQDMGQRRLDGLSDIGDIG